MKFRTKTLLLFIVRIDKKIAIIINMKLFYLLITIAVLASCGGDGGGVSVEPPTDNMPMSPVDDLAVMELMTQLDAAKTIIATTGISAEQQSEYERQILALERDLQANNELVAELTAKLNLILQEIQNTKSTPEPEPEPEPEPMPEPIPSAFDTAEYQANLMYEAIQPLHAYNRGYFGEGVTVAILEHRPYYNIKHPDLAANYITTSIDGIDDNRLATTHDSAHGAQVAGILGATRNGVGMHGIAPEVKMIPFSSHSRCSLCATVSGRIVENWIPIGKYLRDNNIPIVNNSWGAQYYPERPLSVMLTTSRDIKSAKEFNDSFGDTDSIFVWAAGNNNFGTPNFQALFPFFHSRLQTLWVAAMAVDANLTIQRISNACGPAKDWCVATGVYNLYTTTHGDEYRSGGIGTSIAAPQVSGALAILYGAIGMDSPQLARAILLTTATDLGDEGVDDIYGWGLVNISAGIVMIENMESAGTEELAAVSFANLRGELPSGFAHLHNELSAIKLAIKLTTDLYYNVALSELLTPGDDALDVPLGDGATDMLADSESDSRRGFFAYGDMDAELGLRYYGGTGGFSYIAEGQHAKTNQRFFAGDFGSLGGVNGKVYSGKVGFVRDMNMAGMQIFGDYERAAVGGDGDEGNLIVGVRDAQAESWMAGLSFADIWKYGDRIKLSARQEMGLSGGDLIVRYPHAVGDFHETFIGEGTQEIEVREAFLPLKQKAKMRYTAGYAQKINAKSEWAAALEYNAGNNAKALSLIWQGEF